MTEAIDIHREVYEHLYNMNEKLVSNVFDKITPELMAIMSQDAYSEMIQIESFMSIFAQTILLHLIKFLISPESTLLKELMLLWGD